ncbi:ADP-ribosylglycohydrolase family protein [bacterium]|nr:ADP-ribosylglycohydrolase family protein [bacterium]
MERSRKESLFGCVIGGAIGDAAASAFEGTPCRDLPEQLEDLSHSWRITDDTQMTLATCEALFGGKVDPELIENGLLKWFRARRIRGAGSSTTKALRDLAAGCHWALAGSKGEHSAGNGAAMRIAPLAFFVDLDSPEGRRMIRDVCRITHHNDEAYVGAVATALAIRSAARSAEPASLSEIASSLPDSVVRDRLLSLASFEAASIDDAAGRTGTSGFVAESVPLALFAGRQALTIGFAEMIRQVIMVGGDTDTIASIAGQIAGASMGLSGLPSELIHRLPEKELMMNSAQRLVEVPVFG